MIECSAGPRSGDPKDRVELILKTQLFLLQVFDLLVASVLNVHLDVLDLLIELVVGKHPANPSCRFAQAQSLGRQRCGSSSPIRL